jgi:heme-degrading monooxygenase HmoA
MHALLVTYSLERSTAAEHAELGEELAPAIEAVPGLIDHRRLANEATGRFGAFYVFETRPAFDRFVATELFAALCSHHTVRDCVTSDFAVDDLSALNRSPRPGGLP